MKYSLYVIGAVFLLEVISTSPLQAQYTTFHYIEGVDQNAIPSSSSILTDQPVYGRFGKTESGGYLSPSPNNNTRLNPGAFFSQNGGFIGLNNNTPNSRFQPYWEQNPSTTTSDPNEILEMLRNRKILDQAKADQLELQAPKSVHATDDLPPVRFNRSGNGISYYSSGEHANDFGRGNLAPVPQNDQEYLRSENRSSQQGTWIRSPGTERTRPEPIPSRTPPDGSHEVDLGSRMVGNITLPANNMPDQANMVNGPQTGIPVAAPPLPVQDPRVSFQEYLELMILRSPKVNPLSPIQILFNNGTATIRGIVPTQEHRLEAGRILLSDSRVQKVDNRLTVLPSNFDKPLPAPFDPNIPK